MTKALGLPSARAARKKVTPECFGDEVVQAAQEVLFERRNLLLDQPSYMSQGRTLVVLGTHVDDMHSRLEAVWFVPRVLIQTRIVDVEYICSMAAEIGYEVRAALTYVTGEEADVWEKVEAVLAERRLVSSCLQAELSAKAPIEEVRTIQRGQQAAGVTPVPGWILRGRDGRTFTVVLRHEAKIIGAASVQTGMCGSAQVAMVFGIWLRPEWRGRGLGTLLNACALKRGLEVGATEFIEILEDANGASARINRNCGLHVATEKRFLFLVR